MEYNNNFEYDLKVGEMYERELGNILEGKRIEVKTDFLAFKTGNVFIEYESRGKPSGIAKTEAEWYAVIILDEDKMINNIILIPTERLKEIARRKLFTKWDVLGGDNNTSKGILIKISELVD